MSKREADSEERLLPRAEPRLMLGFLSALVVSFLLVQAAAIVITPTRLLLSSDRAFLVEVSTSSWEKPRSGWLYVLHATGVLLLDPESGQVKGRIQAGRAPEMALSPDGGRLYLASGDQLSVIDTAYGEPLQTVGLRYRWEYKVWPERPVMAVSPDGRWLYISKMLPGRGDAANARYTVATFDTTAGAFLPEEAQIAKGYGTVLIPSLGGFQILHMRTNEVRFLQLAPSGAIAEMTTLPLPERSSADVEIQLGLARGGGFWNVRDGLLLPDGHTLITIMGDGRMQEVDVNSKKISRILVKDGLPDRWVPWRRPVCTPDGSKLYMAVGRLATRTTGMVEEILVIDTKTGQQLATIATSLPFLSLAMSPDGQYLYAPTLQASSLLVIDAVKYREMRVIKDVGSMPALAVYAP
ncbi:MAG: hypothetical protein L0387_37385 [Acidobacteria bacterium]|nr:hypothetical protein [Acidobacteriota bacterium]MCI0720531.1 hypothetical protein [Acidobacteriota bacterium]